MSMLEGADDTITSYSLSNPWCEIHAISLFHQTMISHCRTKHIGWKLSKLRVKRNIFFYMLII